ncbi:MAG: hypothetical protein Q7S27_05795 [Nanoarchaeota archaeon]|nr:hypothetical protein [Nanoarchaeota archaeon]
MENKELIDIKDFTLDFFKNLDCEVKMDKGIFIINKIPVDFEEYYGKKGPYTLVFDQNVEGGEFVGAGSTLLKSMQDYLDRKGQTSLLRLAIEIDPVKEVSQRIKLGNCKIEQVIQKKEYNVLKRFTFSSIFQYLNEKERFLNSIYVDRGNIAEFDISKYSSVEGRKDDVNIGDIKRDHQIAKDELKKIILGITEKIGAKIEEKLEKEIVRIKDHYGKQIKEKEEQIGGIERQLKKAEEQFNKTAENEKKQIQDKIEKLKKDIEIIKNSDLINKTKKEEDFLINDEIRKHGLNISNKLINTTIVYYPTFILDVNVINSQSKGNFEVRYNPHIQSLSFPFCRACNREIMDVYLCSSGHASCRLCLMKCLCCSKEYCKNCVDKKCSSCFRDICKKCYLRCNGCGKGFCEMHIRKINDNQHACLSCFASCIGCSKAGIKKNFFKCPSCGSEACENCSRKIFVKAGIKMACPRCTQKCDACKKLYQKSEYYKLRTCECDSCNSLTRCLSCKRVLCKRVRKQF